MKCQHCKERDAVVHLTKVINGEKQEYDLCESCARELNELSFEQSFDFHKFFSGLLDIDNSFYPQQSPVEELRCPLCKMGLNAFKKTGKVGCDHCYEVFGEHLEPLIRRIHGSEEHKGKIPHNTTKNIRLKKEIEELKEQLQRAVENEEYELAAKLRDEIKAKNEGLS
ncbi:UvrB/UvrC motif-containing protein [Irregularibacter muris]|jgi:protein arginine kinase activator|uniref:UvrB/UvrC motif-containing protein n=1 Tax=Irregularibacter muris TaxID=1796619 RepID=A0AAE3HDY0_9FIRM|nr:UvrB/UvrC motif-containing protein [Irregularibacter muris]MCR1898716.1 UvrB/UvrC motif-containing protein [Irregularibacter muris]